MMRSQVAWRRALRDEIAGGMGGALFMMRPQVARMCALEDGEDSR
jgi:hypothetical protein